MAEFEELLLRLRDVEQMVGLGKSTIYRKIEDGAFPRPMAVAPNVVRWRLSDIRSWMGAQSPIGGPDQPDQPQSKAARPAPLPASAPKPSVASQGPIPQAPEEIPVIDADGRRNVLPLSLPPRSLSRVGAAAYIGVSPSLFDDLVADGRMPMPKLIGTRHVWDRLQIDAAFDALPEKGGRRGNPPDIRG